MLPLYVRACHLVPHRYDEDKTFVDHRLVAPDVQKTRLNPISRLDQHFPE